MPVPAPVQAAAPEPSVLEKIGNGVKGAVKGSTGFFQVNQGIIIISRSQHS